MTDQTAYLIKSNHGYYNNKSDLWYDNLRYASLMDKKTAKAWLEHFSNKDGIEILKIKAESVKA